MLYAGFMMQFYYFRCVKIVPELCMCRIWNVRVCDPMVAVLDAWKDLLPSWMLTHVLEQLVFPKLQAEVSVWNPLTDTVPIHAWIHPWLPLMGW